jgi:sulfur-oxidizing protein SoxY
MNVLLARRHLLLTAGAFAAVAAPARATPANVAAEIAKLLDGKTPQRGRVKLDLPVLVENGNAVAMTVSVPEKTSAKLTAFHIFAEGNPLPQVASFHFGPRAGAAKIATRIRLATSQTVIVLALFDDGSAWTDSVDLLVTLAACLDDA